jgi:hypothetical protein
MSLTMDEAIRRAIEAIHSRPHGIVLVCAGGGTAAVEWLFSVPGASATMLEVLVPYHRAAMTELLGNPAEKATGPETAAAMAERAFERARRWAEAPERPVLGVGCTAALATNYPKRGDHRAAIAVRDADGVTMREVTLVKGARDRPAEEQVVSRLLLAALAEACAVKPEFDVGLRTEEPVTVTREERASPIARLLRGELHSLVVLPDGQMLPDGRLDAALFPGAFNPLHAGHRGLAAVAAAMLGRPVAFEISVENVDKPPLTEAEVRRRQRQFEGVAPLVLTRAPTFLRKAQLFPGAMFVIGYDTLERLFAPRYYGGEPQMQAALAEMQANGTRFVVGGRRVDDCFHTLGDFPLPAGLQSMFAGIPREQFDSPLSSTAMRTARADLDRA